MHNYPMMMVRIYPRLAEPLWQKDMRVAMALPIALMALMQQIVISALAA